MFLYGNGRINYGPFVSQDMSLLIRIKQISINWGEIILCKLYEKS